MLKVHFLGTGTSTALPVGPCLAEVEKPSRDVGLLLDAYKAADDKSPHRWGGYDPNGKWPASVPCGSCRAAVDPDVHEGWKNRRGNPALVLRKQNAKGVWKNVVVDVGKTFREQSCRLFPRWGIKRIDAVVITHGHADAYNGLDDLREWCGRQGSAIPIYLDKATFSTVAQSYPYLVDKTKASGGGDLPSLQFKIVEDESEFEVEGIRVTTLPVHHGRYFHAPAPAPSAPATPGNTTPVKASTPVKPNNTPAKHAGTPHFDPFWCQGFVFDQSLIYLSDVSSVPESTWVRLEAAVPDPSNALLIVDTLWPWRPHVSHVSFPQAMEIALRIKPAHTLLVGMTHPTTHHIWQQVGRSVRGAEDLDAAHADSALAEGLLKKIWECEDMLKIADELKAWAGTVEPAWDGLTVDVGPNGISELPIGEGSAGGWSCWGTDLYER